MYRQRFHSIDTFHKSLGFERETIMSLVDKSGEIMGSSWLQEVREMMSALPTNVECNQDDHPSEFFQ